MGGGDLNLKKSWHPHTMKNQERVWKAEQAKQEEQRKLDDLRKEINEERDREELRRHGENSGVLASSSNGGEAKLEWMYKNSAELINREEYLMGRKIDKSFEQLQAEERRQDQSTVGLKQSINHVEHDCVPFSIREYRNLQSTEQVDMQRKTMEDPLMLIKQREMESRRKLLENPVKLKEIHRILKTEQEQAAKHNKKSKKSKKSKKKKRKKDCSSDDSDDSDDDLDRKLARQVNKLKDDTANGDLKLDKLLNAKYRTLTKQLDMATKPKKSKKSKKTRQRSDSSESSGSSSESSQHSSRKKSHDQRERNGKSSSEHERAKRRDQRMRSRSNSYNDKSMKPRGRQHPEHSREVEQTRLPRGRRDRSEDERLRRRERPNESRSYQSLNNNTRRRSRSRSPRKTQQQERHRSRSNDRQRRRSRSNDRQRRRSRSNDRQRTQPRAGSRDHRRRSLSPANPPQRRETPPVRQPASNHSAKSKSKLSESEREARLREMMDNATWRDADRTKVVQKHREAYAREEAQHQERDFDKQFINKEVRKAIDNQSSIGNRIRSNLNNIQRTSAAMDSNFARK